MAILVCCISVQTPLNILSLFNMYDVNQGLDFPELHVKGQLISKGLFGAKLDQNNNEIFLRISALAPKKRLDQKIKALCITN